MSSKYVQMSLELGKELDKTPLEGAKTWAQDPETKKKYLALYNQFKKEKEENGKLSKV